MAVSRVGLISDTHGWLDPRVTVAFTRAGVERIIHAGDIGGDPDVLWQLEAIAPVTAVLGNCDHEVPGFELGGLARTSFGGLRILVIHDLGDLGPIPEDVDVVVRGHSHVPGAQWHGRVLVVNPGSASQRRSMPGCTVGVLEIAENGVPEFEVVELDELGPRIRPRA